MIDIDSANFEAPEDAIGLGDREFDVAIEDSLLHNGDQRRLLNSIRDLIYTPTIDLCLQTKGTLIYD